MEAKQDFQKMPSYDDLLILFKRVDTNNSGCISLDELQDALSVNTLRPFNKKTLKIFLDLVDKNKSGTVNFEEFGALYKYLAGWLKWYQTFDFNYSGLLDCKEFKHALWQLGYYLTIKEVNQYLENYDRSGTGNIDFDDFVEVCVEISRQFVGQSIHDRIIAKVMRNSDL